MHAIGSLPAPFDQERRARQIPPRRRDVVTRPQIGADRMFIDAPPALPTVLMPANLRVRLDRQRPRRDADPSLALLFSAAFAALGVLLAFAGV